MHLDGAAHQIGASSRTKISPLLYVLYFRKSNKIFLDFVRFVVFLRFDYSTKNKKRYYAKKLAFYETQEV
jgi:hypothetical protein